MQAASNAAEVACTPSPPKIPIPLVSPPRGEQRIPFLSRRNAAENRRSPPRSATPRWQTLRPRPDSLSNILVEERPTRHLCTIIEDRIAVATSCFLSETRRIADLTLPRIHTSRFNPRSPATSHSPYALLPNIFFSFFVRRLAESLR